MPTHDDIAAAAKHAGKVDEVADISAALDAPAALAELAAMPLNASWESMGAAGVLLAAAERANAAAGDCEACNEASFDAAAVQSADLSVEEAAVEPTATATAFDAAAAAAEPQTPEEEQEVVAAKSPAKKKAAEVRRSNAAPEELGLSCMHSIVLCSAAMGHNSTALMPANIQICICNRGKSGYAVHTYLLGHS